MNAKEIIKRIKNTKSIDAKKQLIKGLGKYAKGKTVQSFLLGLTENQNEEIRAAAVDSLLINKKKVVKMKIVKHLEDINLVKVKCFEYIGYHKMSQFLPLLVSFLVDEDFWVRYYAVLNIGDMGDESYLEIVKQHLENEQNDVVRAGYFFTLFLLIDEEQEWRFYIRQLENLLVNSQNNVARFVTINFLIDVATNIGTEQVEQLFKQCLLVESDLENQETLKNGIRSVKYWR
ncbi:HEAT repeat-containing protein [Listeria floridensis FSL S10-1187]|uniref:HEAT repeat-containing protein n=1 Tax=Listeria floridensis FSL S10-1187 TaxID=1265817 RepID=A0ABN0RG01_9LIST|nr:HEAT repeat domain-containing protein [Listeria floridensis]EUJ32441.1 HEAT repeat-containing protein [Listeria floridensis FSL S10-1187]